MKEGKKELSKNGYVIASSIPDPYERPVSLAAPETEFEPSNLSIVKCHFCYRMQVDVVCHHCGRYVCHKCQKKLRYKLYRLLNWSVADPTFAKVKPLTSSKFKLAAHCPNCLHTNFRPWLIALFTILLFMVFGTLITGWWKLSLMLLFISAFVWVSPQLFPGLNRLLLRPPVNAFGLPLFCKVKIELFESVKAHFNISEREYIDYDEQGQGELGMTYSLKPADRERLETLFPQTARNNQLIKLNAGFLLLDQIKNVRLRSLKRRLRNNLLLLNTEMAYQEFANICNQSLDVELGKESYTIDVKKSLQINPPKNKMFPILIKPRLVKGGYRFEIKIEVVDDLRLNFPDKDEDEEKHQGFVGKIVLDFLKLAIPDTWDVVDTNGFYDQSGWIKWEKRVFGVNGVLTNYVDFQKKEIDDISEVPQLDGTAPQEDPSKVLTGTYQVTIEDWTLSQLCIAQDCDNPVFRLTNGIRILADDEELDWIKPTIKHKTTIDGDLHIDLPFLVIQQVLALADVSPKSCFDYTQKMDPKVNIFEDDDQDPEIVGKEKLLVAPSYHVINEIVDALTAKNVYIEQIRETPGYMVETESGGNQVSYWEIKGKHYPDELQPTDFHLVISGEASRSKETNDQGTLTFELSMRSYIHLDKDKTDRYNDFRNRFIDLKGAIKSAAYKGRQVNYQGRRVASWEQEQRVEHKLEQRPHVTCVAAILDPNSAPKVGHIFLVTNGNYIPEKDEWLNQWHLHSKSQLPRVSKFDQSIDKWELMREIEVEH